jgi:KDO2-lipid IV(A) lauroyltransferase
LTSPDRDYETEPRAENEPVRSARARLAHAFIRLFRNFDPERALSLAATLGRAYARVGLPRVREAKINLGIAFPSLSRRERDALLIESFANLGRGVAETALLQGPHRDALFARVRIEGDEHIASIIERGTGALVASAHFGSWELCGAALAARGYPLTSVYRPREDTALDDLVSGWRADSGMEVLAVGGKAALGLRRALKRGRFVAMLLDQNARRDEGIFVPFFGELACTRFAPVHLAMLFDVPVLPVFFYREADGSHVARVGAPLDLEPEPAPEAEPEGEAASEVLYRNVVRVNCAIEEAIRLDPSQWMWAHRRYRTRPPGTSALYPRSRGLLRWIRHRLRKRA